MFAIPAVVLFGPWRRYKTPTSAVSYSGKVGGLDVHLAQNGPSTEYGICKVGTTAAFLTTYLSLDVFKPDLVISAGTAGGFKSNGADIASIFVSTTTVNHDRRIPLPGFKEFGLDKKATHPMSKIAASLGMLPRFCVPSPCMPLIKVKATLRSALW